tara:strand:- start:1039 stop:1692 length:654 start_codon:yes stop_codon:yes gene_type:complete
MKDLLKKLHKASNEAKSVTKEKKSGGMNFEPLLADKVKEVAMKAFIENKLYPICNYETHIKDNFVMIVCNMKIYNVENPNEFIEVNGSSGYGKLDRYGTGNGMTYSQKYAYLAALNLKTGIKDEDGYNFELNENTTSKQKPNLKVVTTDKNFVDDWISKMNEVAKYAKSQNDYEKRIMPLREEYQTELHQISTDLVSQQRIDDAESKLKQQINMRYE